MRRMGRLAPRDIAQLHVVRFDQAAAATAQIHPIEAAETEEALVENKHCAMHDSSRVARSLDESCRSWPQHLAATVKAKQRERRVCSVREGRFILRGKAE